MNYTSDRARLIAFAMRDPFAAKSFFVANASTGRVCRTNCDVHNLNVKKSEVVFIDDMQTALADGFSPCEYSLPEYLSNPADLPPSASPFASMDLELLIRTVKDVNARIKFIQPLDFDLDSHYYYTHELQDDPLEHTAKHTSEHPVSPSASKNDRERVKLVDIACRHLALAALVSLCEVDICLDDVPGRLRRGFFTFNELACKRKRGGVLGFKELAQKCGMSAWHFHRVFKAITNVTPKAYGDKCFDYIRSHESEFISGFASNDSIIISARITGINAETAPQQSQQTQQQKQKSAKHQPSQVPPLQYPLQPQHFQKSNESIITSCSLRRPSVGSNPTFNATDDQLLLLRNSLMANPNASDSSFGIQKPWKTRLKTQQYTGELMRRNTITISETNDSQFESLLSAQPMRLTQSARSTMESSPPPLKSPLDSFDTAFSVPLFNENYQFNSGTFSYDAHTGMNSVQVLDENFLFTQLRKQKDLNDRFYQHSQELLNGYPDESEDPMEESLIDWSSFNSQ